MDETRTVPFGDPWPLSELTEAEVGVMVDASPDGMLLADEMGTILFVNSQMESMFGFDRCDLLGQPVEKLVPEQSRSAHRAHRTRYRADPSRRAMGSGIDLTGQRRDGSAFPVEISLSPIHTDDGLRVVATIRDVSERLALDAHHHAVRRTIDAAHDGVFMFDPETLRFSYANHGAAQQLGYTAEELLEMTPLHIKPSFTEQSFRALLSPLVADEVESHTFSTVHRRKDGTDVPVEIVMEYPPSAVPSQPRIVVALVRDITMRLRAEQAARAKEVRLELLEDRERLARDLHDVVIQRLFAAGMGLNAVQPLATDPTLGDRITETVEQLDLTITELRSAIFDLTTNRNQATTQVQGRIDDAVVNLGHQPSLHLLGDLETVPRAVLEQLLPTLSEALSNVARHARATTTTITIDAGGETVLLTVTDDGVGIDPAAPRGDGLSNLATRAEKLGGLASITSSPDEGTTVTWTAPRS